MTECKSASQLQSTLAVLLLTGIASMAAGASTQAARARSLAFSKQTEAPTLCTRVESALAAHEFASLDSTEQHMRDPSIRLVGGNSQLYHYFGALAGYSDASLQPCHSQFTFDQKRELLEQWLGANPQSIAAHIAMSYFWSNAGWAARGENFDPDVTDRQWQTLAADLDRAKSALADIDARVDPHLYFVLIEIAQGQPHPRPVLDQLYASAVKAYPGYFHYYSQRVNLLQERWFGRPDELRTYSVSLLQSPGGDAGLVAYSYVAANLMQFNQRSTLLRTTGLSWPIIKSAYATREKLYGLRNRDWNALCNLAIAANDRDTARAAIEKIAGQWDPAVWKERRYFDYAVTWSTTTQN
jgi:hypothetical protein